MESILKILEDNANLTHEQLAVMCQKEVGDIKKYIKEQEAKAAAMQKKEGEGNDPGNRSVTESGAGDQ